VGWLIARGSRAAKAYCLCVGCHCGVVGAGVAVMTNWATQFTPGWTSNAWLVWSGLGVLVLAWVALAGAVTFRGPVEGRSVARRADVDLYLQEGLRGRRWPSLDELSDTTLGPTPTIYTADDCAPYVSRPAVDEQLRDLLRESRKPPFPFIAVVGPSKAGKSRTALESGAELVLRSAVYCAEERAGVGLNFPPGSPHAD
jgi:hypothetical protein